MDGPVQTWCAGADVEVCGFVRVPPDGDVDGGGLRGCFSGEGHAVGSGAGVVRGGHCDGDLCEVVERDLVTVAVGFDLDVGLGLCCLGCHDSVDCAVVGDSGVVDAVGVELAEVDAAERQRSEARVDSVGHVVGVDAAAPLVNDIHEVAVRPDTSGAVVAGTGKLPELLAGDTLKELRRFAARPGVSGLAARPGVLDCDRLCGRVGQAVGEDAFGGVVRDPNSDTVRPQAAGVAVVVVEQIVAEQPPAPQVIGEQRLLLVKHPQDLTVGPDTASVAVGPAKHDLAPDETVAAVEVVDEDPVLAAVRNPNSSRLGPQTTRETVGVVKHELAVLNTLTGVKTIRIHPAAAEVVVDDPQSQTIRPRTRKLAVVPVEALDVMVHRPLKVNAALDGPAADIRVEHRRIVDRPTGIRRVVDRRVVGRRVVGRRTVGRRVGAARARRRPCAGGLPVEGAYLHLIAGVGGQRGDRC